MSTDERIVVGVSGSAERRLRTAEIWVVHAWSSPMEMLAPYVPMRGVPSYDQQRQAFSALLAAAISTPSGPDPTGLRPVCDPYWSKVIPQRCCFATPPALAYSSWVADFDFVTRAVVARTCIAHAPCPTVLIAAAEVADDVEASSSSLGHICIRQ